MDGRLIARMLPSCGCWLLLLALTACDDETSTDTKSDAAPVEGSERDGEADDAASEPGDDADAGSEQDAAEDDLDANVGSEQDAAEDDLEAAIDAPEDDAATGGEEEASADAAPDADPSDADVTADAEPAGDADSTQDGEAPCVPACAGKACGEDGCGGSCGTCPAGNLCSASGACSCQPACDGKACGPDGCGGSCGTCTEPQACDTSLGTCVASCEPSCSGKQCGDDGCGGSCGECDDGETCSGAAQCVCAPDCVGRACGPDGCGGVCGSCPDGKSCGDSGECIAPSFADDVYPILMAAGCPDCHDASTPSAGLDLSSAVLARDNLLDGPSGQCSPARTLVVAGSPETSYLINKLTGVGMCSGQRMPRGRPPLSDTQIDDVRAWIEAGAAP